MTKHEFRRKWRQIRRVGRDIGRTLESVLMLLTADPRNPIGLLETALQISTAKAKGCDQGICTCDESEDCLAKGWEKFVPPQQKLLLDEKRRNQLQIAFTSLVPMRLPIL